MKYVQTLAPRDLAIARHRLAEFLPTEVYDIHAHPYHPEHFAPGAWKFFDGMGPQGCAEHRAALQRYMAVPTIHGLYFGIAETPKLGAIASSSRAGQLRRQL
jgi:glutamate-1-semialdehyde 2,1-aminomutase